MFSTGMLGLRARVVTEVLSFGWAKKVDLHVPLGEKDDEKGEIHLLEKYLPFYLSFGKFVNSI